MTSENQLLTDGHLLDEDGTCSANCFRCKILTVQIAPRGAAKVERGKDAELDKNRTAYVNLRKDGLQPKSIHTAAQMESRATERWEVETGRLVPDASEKARYTEAFDHFPKPSADPIVREVDA